MTRTERTPNQQKWVHLHESDEGGVVVQTADGDMVTIPMVVAVAACKTANQIQQFANQLGKMLQYIGQWVSERQQCVQHAYLTFRDAGLMLLIVRSGKEYDEELEDNLTSLDIAIAQDESLDLIHLSVLAIPNSSKDCIDSFLDTRKPIFKYANL